MWLAARPLAIGAINSGVKKLVTQPAQSFRKRLQVQPKQNAKSDHFSSFRFESKRSWRIKSLKESSNMRSRDDEVGVRQSRNFQSLNFQSLMLWGRILTALGESHSSLVS
jgi:hypothetical protein